MNRYEINVATSGGGHYCNIAIPETYEPDAKAKALCIAMLFGPGFKVSMTVWNDVGRTVAIS